MNAKPFPYFDGGVMFLRKEGYFAFYSSRNNNFSNRQQSGLICVGSNCTIDNSTGVLQGANPMFDNADQVVQSAARTSVGACVDTANSNNGANNNGASSCIFDGNSSTLLSENNILKVESFTRQEADNDSEGDGTMEGCGVLFFTADGLEDSVEQQVVLAIVLLLVGVFASWCAFYIYNRYRAKRDAEPRFRSSTDWQGKSSLQMFSFGSESGPGKKVPHMAKDII